MIGKVVSHDKILEHLDGRGRGIVYNVLAAMSGLAFSDAAAIRSFDFG